jgi:hypothetical protein
MRDFHGYEVGRLFLDIRDHCSIRIRVYKEGRDVASMNSTYWKEDGTLFIQDMNAVTSYLGRDLGLLRFQELLHLLDEKNLQAKRFVAESVAAYSTTPESKKKVEDSFKRLGFQSRGEDMVVDEETLRTKLEEVMRSHPFYSRRASEIADDYIKSDPFMFGDSLRDGIVTREEIEFHFFVMHGFNGSWSNEIRRKLEIGPLQPIPAHDDEYQFECVADVLGKNPKEIEERYNTILKKMEDYFNRRGERYTEEEYRRIIEEMDKKSE